MFPIISGKHQEKSIKDVTVAEERITLPDEQMYLQRNKQQQVSSGIREM